MTRDELESAAIYRVTETADGWKIDEGFGDGPMRFEGRTWPTLFGSFELARREIQADYGSPIKWYGRGTTRYGLIA